MLDIQKYNISNDFILKSMPCNYLETSNLIFEGRLDVDNLPVYEGISIVFNDVKIEEDFIPLGIFNIRSIGSDANNFQDVFNNMFNTYAIEPLRAICTETIEIQVADIYVKQYNVNTTLNSKAKKVLALRNVLQGLNIDYTQFMLQPLTFKPILYYASFNDASLETSKQPFELFYLTKP